MQESHAGFARSVHHLIVGGHEVPAVPVERGEPHRRREVRSRVLTRIYGDTTVLTEYDQHGRITGGDPEQMVDAAAAAYVALTASGTDTLLMAADHALRRELSRRIRDDLITLGIVQPGPAVTIAEGARASPGDLIICTRNDHTVEAGEPGRTLANGDLLRIDTVTAGGLLVRRALDADPRTGQRRWTRHQALADADHRAALHAIWAAETTPARDQHYRDLRLLKMPFPDCGRRDGISVPDRRGPHDWLTAGALLTSCMPTGAAAA
jgi:hypothetical protein